MWLPKDERRLLAGYYRRIREVGTKRSYRISVLRPLLAFWQFRLNVPEYGSEGQPSDDDAGDPKRWVEKFFNETNRIKKANKHLHERGLITLEHHEHVHDVVLIGLTVDGYDLGRKYACILTNSGLWYEEFRKHWLWLIVAFFGGALGTKLLDFIAAWMVSP